MTQDGGRGDKRLPPEGQTCFASREEKSHGSNLEMTQEEWEVNKGTKIED